jgi:hypothetical protein
MSRLGSPGIFADPKDQPNPVSVLDSPSICDSNRRLLYSSENFIAASPRKLETISSNLLNKMNGQT